MNDSRDLYIVTDYMQTILAASGNAEFVAFLTNRLAAGDDDFVLTQLDQMTIGELHELFEQWNLERDE